MIRKRLVQLVFFGVICTLLPHYAVAKTAESVEVELYIIGSNNHLVYTVPMEFIEIRPILR